MATNRNGHLLVEIARDAVSYPGFERMSVGERKLVLVEMVLNESRFPSELAQLEAIRYFVELRSGCERAKQLGLATSAPA